VPTAVEQAADLSFLESQFSNVPIRPECEAAQKFEHEPEFNPETSDCSDLLT